MTMIMDILVACANSLPNDTEVSRRLQSEPELIRQAFKAKNSDMLRASVSCQKFYANETRVTIY